MQRFFDFIFSAFALIFLTPLLLSISIILFFSGEGEIFFLQERVGLNGNLFKLYKFATMLKNSPNIRTGTVTLKNDPRILPFGNFLRRTKINELPQLLNILRGEMSFVGPRPQTPRCFNAFSITSQKKIIKVKPGLSGIGSIIFRNEENMIGDQRNPHIFYDSVIMSYKGKLEEWYVKNISIWLYFKVLFLTVWIIFFPQSEMAFKIFRNIPLPAPYLLECIRKSYVRH